MVVRDVPKRDGEHHGRARRPPQDKLGTDPVLATKDSDLIREQLRRNRPSLPHPGQDTVPSFKSTKLHKLDTDHVEDDHGEEARGIYWAKTSRSLATRRESGRPHRRTCGKHRRSKRPYTSARCPRSASNWSDLEKMSTRLLAETFDLVVYATLGGRSSRRNSRTSTTRWRAPSGPYQGRQAAREQDGQRRRERTVRGTSELEQL